MKQLVNLILVLAVSGLYAQTSNTARNASNLSNAMLAGANASTLGSSAMFVNPPKNVKGSVHLFEDWDNLAVIYSLDDDSFSLKNINLNLDRNAFESKVSDQEVFIFNFNNINKIVVNNRTFKSYYHRNINRVFEVLYSKDGSELLKGYQVSLIEGSSNPMVNRPDSRYVTKESYYVKENDEIKSFKFKKKNVLKFVDGDKGQANQIMNLAKIK